MRLVLPAMFVLGCFAAPAFAVDCAATLATSSSLTLAAPAPGLDVVSGSAATIAPGLGAHAEDLSAAAVLQRMRDAECARVQPVATEEYQKRTEFDNTPYRYNMQAGKLNAAEFEAWMASRGIRIVRADEVAPVGALPAAVSVAQDTAAAAAPAAIGAAPVTAK